MAVKISLCDSPFQRKNMAAPVMLDAPRALASKMIKPAVPDDAESAATCHPEFHQQVIIAAHTGAEFQAVAAQHAPPFFMRQRGLRGSAFKVAPFVRHMLHQELRLVESSRGFTKVLFDDGVIPAIFGLNQRAEE